MDRLLLHPEAAGTFDTHPGVMEWWRWRAGIPLTWPDAATRPYWVHRVFETLCTQDFAERQNDSSGDMAIADAAGMDEMARLKALSGID